MDVLMKGMSGLEAIGELKKRLPEANILALTIVDNPEYFLPVLKSGACGYLLKEAEPEELLAAVRAAAQGIAYLSPRVATVVLSGLQAERDRYASLSVREREVLALVAQGYTSREVAERLYLSPKTVEKYRARLMGKLGISSRAELISYAVNRGLLRPSTGGDPATMP